MEICNKLYLFMLENIVIIGNLGDVRFNKTITVGLLTFYNRMFKNTKAFYEEGLYIADI